MRERLRKFWLYIIKPSGFIAKGLLFILLVGVLISTLTGHFENLRTQLDVESLTFSFGGYEISAFKAVTAFLALVALVWLAAIISDFLEQRIIRIRNISRTNKVIWQKIVQILVYIIAFLVALDVLGIDLTALKVFGGALGIGLGFGLQKIASNFVSGLILLFEKSVELGDMVELSDGTFGFVRKTGARFTLIETFDGKEIMVPNEDFITNRVVNWTFSNTKARVEVPIGVSYGSDLDRVHEIILEAAKAHPRCLEDPQPICYLREFGDSSVNFLLHFWVGDVTLGRYAPQSEVMFDIWHKFKENRIEIPFPQRDIHIKSHGAVPNGSAE